MRQSKPARRFGRLLILSAIGLLAVACGGAGAASPRATFLASARPAAPAPTGSRPATSPAGSAAPEQSGSAAAGDIPDNAVFLTFKGASPGYSIKYVEGWQVTPQPKGVVIRDKDSSETVAIVAPQTDIPGYVTATDLPALRAQAGFSLIKQDTVKVGSSAYVHLAFHLTSPPDPVTGKQLALTVDRYYVPGPSGLAMVSLATPDGVDNVDAFLQMITSFKWA